MVKTMRTFRWLLVVPSGIIGWYIGIIVAITIYAINDWLCPAKYIVSGTCYGAPWSSFVQDFAVAFGSVIAAVLVVVLPTIIAPDHRRPVAITAYVTGLLCSFYWLFYGQWVPVVWAALAGGSTLWISHRVLTSRSVSSATC